jgi:hypothetical protein
MNLTSCGEVGAMIKHWVSMLFNQGLILLLLATLCADQQPAVPISSSRAAHASSLTPSALGTSNVGNANSMKLPTPITCKHVSATTTSAMMSLFKMMIGTTGTSTA